MLVVVEAIRLIPPTPLVWKAYIDIKVLEAYQNPQGRVIRHQGATPQAAMDRAVNEFVDRWVEEIRMNRMMVNAFGEDGLH